MSSQLTRPTAVDLFCGAGGLSLGLHRAGFDVAVGVEINGEYARTYAANHRRTSLLVRDVRCVTGSDILGEAGLSEIDMLAGCPPCQGFTSLTSKYRREDPRNNLILEMARLAEELKPAMIMMENVPGLAGRGRPLLDAFTDRLVVLGYCLSIGVLQMADYGVPQSRRRLVLLAGRGFSIPLPRPTHSKPGSTGAGLKPWLALKHVIAEMPEPVTLSAASVQGGPRRCRWHVVRDVKPVTALRLAAVAQGRDRTSIPAKLRPPCHKVSDAGFSNVYARMAWDQTPPTITGGCTTFCKGRFGHPEKARTISVREAALIQTFPMSYRIETDYMEQACDMVGNALPPEFATTVSSTCLRAWRENQGG